MSSGLPDLSNSQRNLQTILSLSFNAETHFLFDQPWITHKVIQAYRIRQEFLYREWRVLVSEQVYQVYQLNHETYQCSCWSTVHHLFREVVYHLHSLISMMPLWVHHAQFIIDHLIDHLDQTSRSLHFLLRLKSQILNIFFDTICGTMWRPWSDDGIDKYNDFDFCDITACST